MLHQRLSRRGSRNKHAWEWMRGAVVGCLAFMAAGLAGCGGGGPCGPFDPDCPCDPDTMVCPGRDFRLTLDHAPDPGACRVTLGASASGGEDGAHALWGEVTAKVWDPEIQDMRPVPHPFGRGPDIFGAQRIEKGQTQYGQIDLGCFQQEWGHEVWVELEIHYTIVDGSGMTQSDSKLLQLQC